MGTDILFENHTIKEIQEIEKKLRNDIERKKEELRQMVGERYRDLMEAADTITEMKDIAESIKNRVKSIEDRCNELQEGSLRKGILNTIEDKVVEKRKSNELLYIIASQIKILMDCPTKIWSSVENEDFVSAVSLFLLARHTHSLLVLDPVYQEQRISMEFPIIKRQWTSVNHLRYVLIQNCQRILETQNIEPESVVGPMCCTCLLSSSSLEEIFTEILDVRKNVLKSIFRPEKYAKDQICEFVVVVQMTLKIVYGLLYSEEEFDSNNDCRTNLLQRTLQRIISKEEPGPVSLLDLNSSETFKFLPSAITDFRPSISEPIVPCSSELLQSKCDEWLKDVKSCFLPELVNLLNFVNSVKSIAFIREAVFNHFLEVKNWDKLCTDLLKTPFSIWDCFLKECFLQRIKDIINGCIKCSSEMCQQDIERTLCNISSVKEDSVMEFEKNISLYIWMESSNDVMDNIAWLPRHQRNIINSGELSMKAMGFTPQVQSICRDLDQRMQDAVEDISHFSFLQNGSVEDINLSLSEMNLPDISEDVTDIFKYLVEAVESHIFDLANYIETTLLYMENEKRNFENSCRIVFMGHLCLGIANLCPHINTCLSPDKLCEKIRTSKRQGMKENELWKDLRYKLQKVSASAFKLWGNWQIDQILKNLDSELIAGSAEGLLKALLMWEKVEIQEESEQGKAVKSVLRIPQHVSMPLSNALFGFCCQLNFIGGFSIDSEVRSEMSKHLLIGLLDIYQRKVDASSTAEELNPRLLQVQSLQYLFDVQFLIGFMVHKDNSCDTINSTSQDIINQAISYIDPFDMDVFSVPLQHNLKKALQKSLSLFGLIASPDQVSYLNSIKAHSVSSQMEHNIMPSSNNISRFPILPLSSRTNIMAQGPQDDFQVQTKETDKMPLQSHSSSPNLSASDIPTNPMKSTSFYDRVTAMSSSWFGN